MARAGHPQEATLKEMFAPYPAERMTMWPADKRVGIVKNNDPSLIEPISTASARGVLVEGPWAIHSVVRFGLLPQARASSAS